jgi:signal transduction histidine kinase
MKIFDEAVWKLTAVYTAILLMVTVGFSAAFYAVTDAQLARPFQPRQSVVYENFWGDGEEIFSVWTRQRDDEIRAELLLKLITIDLVVLGAGAVVSYFLARRTLRPVNQALEHESRLVSDASHELRTPLAAIQMENEVLLREKSATKDDYHRQIQSNLEEVYKVSALAERLLKLSHSAKLPLVELDLATLTEQAVKKLDKVFKAHEVKIVNQIKSVKLLANVEALEQILLILLDNAVKYSSRGATVTLETRGKRLLVRDQGSGIAAADLPHIFERFYRAEKSRTTNGHGLGLSLAQHLAAQMNLKITAENNKDRGATFTISWYN